MAPPRERARAAMAAVDRRNPNLDDFVGLSWSCWVDRVNILPSDAESNVEDSSKYGRDCCSETMTLRKEDMHTFGHCPAHDEIYLVVCSYCGQVVKPQAFEKHCERRHGPLIKMCQQSSTSAPQQRPCPARPPSNHSSSRERQKDGRCYEASSSAASPAHQHRPGKAQREAVSFPSVEKFPQENAPFPHHSCSSTPRPKVPLWHSGPLPPGHASSSTSASERPSEQKPTAGQSNESHGALRGTRTYSRVYKNINKKECELNKQCRVLDPERKKPCSRELICNNDSIHQQQQKPSGRTKIVERLAEEQKTVPTDREMEQLLVKSKDKVQHLEAFEEKITTQGSKYSFSSNRHVPSGLSDVPGEEGNSAVEVETQPQHPFNQTLLSDEDSEEDYEQEEDTDLPATTWHPKPLGLCTFGCRMSGCSIFTFDRRLHHLRFALSAMLEHHVSTHLWKKMPQVSSGLRSRHVTSPVRTGARPFKSTGSLNLQSTSLGQLETKTSQHNSHGTKPISCTTSARLEPGRLRHPVGRASKARLREEEFVPDLSGAQKAAKLSHSGEDNPPKYIRDPPLNEKGQPHIPSSRGPVNGNFALGKKPCPPLHRSPRNRGRSQGIQEKVANYDHRSPAQKRKGSNESQLLNSRASKYQGLSSSSCSSLLTWNGENIGDMRALGLEKRSNS
ncbi:ataxin-7-like protein 2b [Plectropomus leopardus]|uniref:ataxin-7-like protein 2b n=1 Tax=Plectropomus leopardus TaxID=160734 RepID=UPI001C4B5230|nr:ataxin-7-like protein 2b [Plectropomus leopardus]